MEIIKPSIIADVSIILILLIFTVVVSAFFFPIAFRFLDKTSDKLIDIMDKVERRKR